MLRGSLTIARIGGIPLRMHWTFLAFLAWIFISGARQGGYEAGLTSAFFMLCVFLCVVLHELGHAFAARRFGVRTQSITLLPIGGVAALERIPENPMQEFVIAIAGPLVNVLIAIVLGAWLLWSGGAESLYTMNEPGYRVGHFLAALAGVNVWLVLFNLIPAFPMDGGRILRAALAAGMGYARATRVAARVGQVVAILMAIAGLFVSPMLILVAVFVWLGAMGESSDVERRALLSRLPVTAAMLRRFAVLSPEAPLDVATRELMSGQHDFPVTAGGTADEPVVGVVTHGDLLAALSRRGERGTVAEAMRREFPTVGEGDLLEGAVTAIRNTGCPVLPVLRAGRLVGLVTADTIAELLSIRGATAPGAA